MVRLRGPALREIAHAHAGQTLTLPEPFEVSVDPAALLRRRR